MSWQQEQPSSALFADVQDFRRRLRIEQNANLAIVLLLCVGTALLVGLGPLMHFLGSERRQAASGGVMIVGAGLLIVGLLTIPLTAGMRRRGVQKLYAEYLRVGWVAHQVPLPCEVSLDGHRIRPMVLTAPGEHPARLAAAAARITPVTAQQICECGPAIHAGVWSVPAWAPIPPARLVTSMKNRGSTVVVIPVGRDLPPKLIPFRDPSDYPVTWAEPERGSDHNHWV